MANLGVTEPAPRPLPPAPRPQAEAVVVESPSPTEPAATTEDWLNRQISAEYEAARAEPVPDHLVALIRAHRALPSSR